ncbi:MAG TPA: glucose-6-phosphate dehydrogenase [Candidatus Xenobia bacterium]
MTLTQTPSPLREGLRLQVMPEPCNMVIFGASGDLAHRKLLPALYNLALENYLPSGLNVIGFARRPKSNEEFAGDMRQAVDKFSRRSPVKPAVWDNFASRMQYNQSTFEDADGFTRLKALIEQNDKERGTCGNRLYYLSTPPSDYPIIIRQLGAAGLNKPGENGSWARIIIEKPFGHDLETAKELNHLVHDVFNEDQIYRIDHYLGKETVQNLFVFRFANGIFEPIWNRNYIDHVQITISESIGVEGRGAFYEQAGVVRDFIQNHLMQLLCCVAMEPPTTFDADRIRDEKIKVMQAIKPYHARLVDDYVVRGQYGRGWVGDQEVESYREEKDVKPDSVVDTYMAVKWTIDNWRWAGVPWFIRAGKRLPKRVTEIAIQFKAAPHLIFSNAQVPAHEPNILVLRIQPDEGISLRFGAKVPGPTLQARSVNMDFIYGSSFMTESPEAYETLILDCMLGEATLFTRSDEVETSWGILKPILDWWKDHGPPDTFPNYESGTWGPRRADGLIESEGRSWRRI